MDRRVFQAAWSGNVECLLRLIEDDPCLLHVAALAGGNSPLHISCMAGHLNFVKEIIKLRQECVRELNQDGFTPLHIASANGHTEIVKEILKVDHNLCLLKGKDSRIPLHYAVIKGKIHVIQELLSAAVDSIGDTTARGEIALHLAVKNSQFEALRILVEHLKKFNQEYLLNKGDEQGNTILHLAVSRKQYEVVDSLLNEHSVATGIVEVNSMNKSGLTPLDVLQLFQSEAGDREIEELLTRAGAKRVEDLKCSVHVNVNQDHVTSTSYSSNDQQRTDPPRSPAKQLIEYFKYDNVKDSPSKVRNTLLVIAILIATGTYQAVLSPPGGVWQDDSQSGGNNSTKGHTAGKAVMGSRNSVGYSLFLLFNSLGFFTALHMIDVLTVGFPMRLELRISIVALIATYDTCMSAIAPNSFLTLFFTCISIAIPFTIPVVTMVVRNHLKRSTGTLPCTSGESA